MFLKNKMLFIIVAISLATKANQPNIAIKQRYQKIRGAFHLQQLAQGKDKQQRLSKSNKNNNFFKRFFNPFFFVFFV